MKSEIVKINAPELAAVEKSKAEEIRSTFEPMAKMLSEFEQAYKDVISEAEEEITIEVSAKAKSLRLDIGKVRIETGKIKDKKKEYIKLEDKAIMGVHNILVWAVTEKEDRLKGIENHFETQERGKLEALQRDRAEKLSIYLEDAHERNLSSMDEDVWESYLATKKREHEDRIAAEKKAEEERIQLERIEKLRWKRSDIIKPYYNFFVDDNSIKLGELSEVEFDVVLTNLKRKKEAYDKEQEQIRLENERLKKEAEENEAKRIIEEESRKEGEAIAEAKRQKEREQREKELQTERDKAAKIQADLTAKEDAERKAEVEQEERQQAELNKGDSDKVKDLKVDLILLKMKYKFKSKKNQNMFSDVGVLIEKIINHIDG